MEDPTFGLSEKIDNLTNLLLFIIQTLHSILFQFFCIIHRVNLEIY